MRKMFKKVVVVSAIAVVFSNACIASAATVILNIPCAITQSGSYVLDKNFTMTVNTANAITVNADNVTIDLMGYTLSGPNLSSVTTNNGIYIKAHKNIEIKNGTVANFDSSGIYSTGASPDKIRVLNVRTIYNKSDGINLSGYGNMVTGCTAADNGGNGIAAEFGSLISENTVYNNANIGLVGLQCTIINNTTYLNDNGVLAFNSIITGNTVTNNLNDGIYGYDCKIEDNYVYANNSKGGLSACGIFANYCAVKGNTVSTNKTANIVSDEGNIIEGNTLMSSPGAAIKFVKAGSCYTGNRINSNVTNYVNPAGNKDGGGNLIW